MSLDTVGCKSISLWYRKHVGRVLSEEEVATIEKDLEMLWSMYSVQFRPIVFQQNKEMTKGGLLTPMFVLGQSFVCYADSAEVDGISGETYWRYRAISNILNHVMMWCPFTWKGRKKAWSQMDNILHTIGASPLTQQFVRNDLLYRSAAAGHRADGVWDAGWLVLDTYKTCTECR